MATQFNGIVWVGVRTSKFEELCSLYSDTMRLPITHEEAGFKAFDFPNGDRVEVFSDIYKDNNEFKTSPVVGFLVDNIEDARKDMEAQGIEFIGPIHGDKSRWSHFKGPDGNIYEITVRNK